MKFATDLDAQQFLAEVGSFSGITKATKEYKPTNEEMGTFLKKRTPLVKKLKDYRKASAQKTNWRKNRHKMMKGIKRFHKSVEGKRFHRRLGNFLATKITRQKVTNEDHYRMLMAKQNFLKGLTSAKQHLFVELEYYHSLDEQVELEEMITDYAIPLFQSIENKILTGQELTDDETTFLFDLTEKKVIINCVAEKFNLPFAKTEDLWKSISNKLYEDKIDELDSTFYPKLIKELRISLGKKKQNEKI